MNPNIRNGGIVILGLAVIIILACFAAVVFGAEPGAGVPVAVIAGPNTGSPIRPILLDGRASNGASFDWHVSPSEAEQGLTEFDGNQRAAFSAAAPGRYMIVLVVDQTVIAGHPITISEGPQPNPFPQPDPQPGKRKVVVILERTTQTPAQAATVQAIDQYTANQNQEFQPADPDLIDGTTSQPAPWLQPYLQAAQARGKAYPVLIIDAAPFGTVESSDAVESLPASGSEAIALIQKNGG